MVVESLLIITPIIHPETPKSAFHRGGLAPMAAVCIKARFPRPNLADQTCNTGSRSGGSIALDATVYPGC